MTSEDMVERAADAEESPLRGLRLSSAQLNAINRFPDDNPNPVMRLDATGRLVYANPASAGVVGALGLAVGERVPADVLDRFESVEPARGFVEVVADNRTFAVWPVPIRDMGFTNLYGMDVTAERAIRKFPDQNPNPVLRLRWDGAFVYANPASAALVAGLGMESGAAVPAESAKRLLGASRPTGVRSRSSEGAGRYALVAVDVPEFGFINVYGTDVTAVKERQRLAPRERTAAPQHPARAHRPPPARRRACSSPTASRT